TKQWRARRVGNRGTDETMDRRADRSADISHGPKSKIADALDNACGIARGYLMNAVSHLAPCLIDHPRIVGDRIDRFLFSCRRRSGYIEFIEWVAGRRRRRRCSRRRPLRRRRDLHGWLGRRIELVEGICHHLPNTAAAAPAPYFASNCVASVGLLFR